MKAVLLVSSVLLFSTFSQGASLGWKGEYQFQYTEIDKTRLAAGGGRKSMATHALLFGPRLLVADGVQLVAEFSLLNDANAPSAKGGRLFGQDSFTDAGGSRQFNRNRGATDIRLRNAYLKWDQEFGSLVVGRAPLEFGLGMTYSAGNGLFDSWSESFDMVAHQFLVDNLSITPILAKSADKDGAQGADSVDVMLNVLYHNRDARAKFGVFSFTRTSSGPVNDAHLALDSTVNPNYPDAASGRGFEMTQTNIYFAREWDQFNIGAEGGFMGGDSGVFEASTGKEIEFKGYGIALEMGFPRPGADWSYGIKTGIASGDNPSTTAYEGFAFSKNYDLGFLLGNHPLGQFDALTSNASRPKNPQCTTAPCDQASSETARDEESVSNMIYFAPRAQYRWKPELTWDFTLVYARLQTSSSRLVGNDISKDLGTEIDIALRYQPHPNIQWINEIGLFSPGAAFKEGSVGRSSDFTYGFRSRLGMSF